jgi:hypothetical protein
MFELDLSPRGTWPSSGLSAWKSVPFGPVTWPDLRGRLSANDRERPLVESVRLTVELPSAAAERCPFTCGDGHYGAPGLRKSDSPRSSPRLMARRPYQAERRLSADRLFRRGMSQVGARCASVLCCYRSLTLAVGCRRCWHRCCQPYEVGPLAQQTRSWPPGTSEDRAGRKRLLATSRAVGGKPESAAVPCAGQPRKLGQMGIVRNSPARKCRPGLNGAYWGIS